MPVSISGDGAITGLELEAFEDVDVGSGASDGDVQTYDASGDLRIPQGIVPIAGIGSNVVQTVKTDTFSTTSSSMVTVTGLTVTITPTSDTSKVLVILSGIIGHSGSNERMQVNLRRDGTNIGLATGGVSGNTMIFYDTGEYNDQYSLVFLDSPATTSAVTYDLQTSTVAGTVQFGRIGVSDRRGINTITAIEVAV